MISFGYSIMRQTVNSANEFYEIAISTLVLHSVLIFWAALDINETIIFWNCTCWWTQHAIADSILTCVCFVYAGAWLLIAILLLLIANVNFGTEVVCFMKLFQNLFGNMRYFTYSEYYVHKIATVIIHC